jgi:thiol-disulfide isomerase/thioredoxin
MPLTKKKWTLRKILQELLTTLVLLFLISTILNFIRQPDVQEDIYAYKLQDIQNNTVKLIEYKNRPLVIHFWGSWCPTCKFEASNIETLAQKHNVISIAVNSGSNEKISDFMAERNFHYPVINDQQGKLAQKFNISAYPTTLIYNSKGELSFSEVGYTTTLGLEARLALLN